VSANEIEKHLINILLLQYLLQGSYFLCESVGSSVRRITTKVMHDFFG